MGLFDFLSSKPERNPQNLADSVYDFKMKSIAGQEVDLSTFKGKQLLIVNTASKCGKTPQYADLQRLHEEHGDTVAVLGFPANNFLKQEPGSNEDIAAFCEMNYGVTFPMFQKISVKGSDQHALYQWLEVKTGKHPDWNFSKYLVSEDGKVVSFFKAGIKVTDAELAKELKVLP
jgi:glutathione peroxidase